jgi:hypothetical protein
LLTSSRQPLNQRLAAHYGVDADVGPDFAFVELDPDLYAGVLGQGAMLTRFTWPTRRGMFVQERLLGGAALPAPPSDHLWDHAELAGETPREKTTNIVAQNPACRGCHALVDSMGFALEAFDDLGRLTGFDTRGELRTSDGNAVQVAGPFELGEAIASSHDGRVGTVRAHLEHLLDRPLGSNDDALAECLAGAFVDGRVELHELARRVALSSAGRLMSRPTSGIIAASDAADPIEHALAETSELLAAFTDANDRAQLDQYLAGLRHLQQMLPLY